MASLSTLDFTTLVRQMAAAVQGGASTLINLTVGSVLRAILEAIAAIVLWLQGLIVYVLTLTRAATSSGIDLDSWMADFGLMRLPANTASGQVTFARFTATTQALVPVGASVQTGDGSQSFTVTVDASYGTYSAGLGGYVLPANTTSILVPVIAVNAGSQGNVLAGAVSSLRQGLSGIDTVTNAAAYANGLDAESDGAYRARFVSYLGSLSKATRAAVDFAIKDVQQGLQDTLTENVDYAGNSDPGFFYAVVDDGSGSPSSGLLNNVGTAIEAVRPLCVTYAVFAPAVETANIVMTITTAPGYDHNTVVGQVGVALTNFINGLGLGNSLPYSKLSAIAYGVTGVTNASGITLNSGTSDLIATAKQTVRAGTVVVS